MSDRKKELREEAKALGIEIKGNPGEEKLQGMIDTYYEDESKAAGIKPVEVKEDVKEVKETETSATPSNEPKVTGSAPKDETSQEKHVRILAARKRENLKTTIVKVNLTDRRENSELASYYIRSGPIGKHIPLDTPIELENCLVKQLKRLKMPMHKEGPNGNKITIMVKKFLVETIK